jgi:uncharacterized membrane protein YhaH (DUF805 family)
MEAFGIGPRIGLRQFGRAFEYSGRSTRSELISFWIVGFIVSVSVHFLAIWSFGLDTWPLDTILVLLTVILFVPWAALMVRRLHDENRSGLWLAVLLAFWLVAVLLSDDDPQHPQTVLGNLAMVIGFVVSLAHFVISLAPGSHGENRFGSDPRLDPRPVIT